MKDAARENEWAERERDMAHMCIISPVHVHTHSAYVPAWVCFPIIFSRSLIEGLVNAVIMILQTWPGAMNVRRAKAAQQWSICHLSIVITMQQLCWPRRVPNLKSLPELQSRTRQVRLTAVISAHSANGSYLLQQNQFSQVANSSWLGPYKSFTAPGKNSLFNWWKRTSARLFGVLVCTLTWDGRWNDTSGLLKDAESSRGTDSRQVGTHRMRIVKNNPSNTVSTSTKTTFRECEKWHDTDRKP